MPSSLRRSPRSGNSLRIHTNSASNPRFLDRGFRGRGNERGERNLTAELEVARLEGCRDIRGLRSGARHRTYLPIHLRIFKYSFSHTGRPRVHLLPPDSAPQPPTANPLVGGCNGLRGNTVTLISPRGTKVS